MAGYVQLGDVNTWYDEHGEGEPLVLLHPGGADARAFAPNLDALAARFHVFTPDRRGHGRTPDFDGPITYELMAADTNAFLETVVGGPAHLLACSDGVPVALLAALRRPDLARRLVLVSGVFHRDGWLPETAEVDDAATQPSCPQPDVGEARRKVGWSAGSGADRSWPRPAASSRSGADRHRSAAVAPRRDSPSWSRTTTGVVRHCAVARPGNRQGGHHVGPKPWCHAVADGAQPPRRSSAGSLRHFALLRRGLSRRRRRRPGRWPRRA